MQQHYAFFAICIYELCCDSIVMSCASPPTPPNYNLVTFLAHNIIMYTVPIANDVIHCRNEDDVIMHPWYFTHKFPVCSLPRPQAHKQLFVNYSTQKSGARLTVLQAVESWAGPVDEASLYRHPTDDPLADWDLEVCLTYECRRKQIRKQAYFSQWIDLRAVYKVCYTNL